MLSCNGASQQTRFDAEQRGGGRIGATHAAPNRLAKRHRAVAAAHCFPTRRADDALAALRAAQTSSRLEWTMQSAMMAVVRLRNRTPSVGTGGSGQTPVRREAVGGCAWDNRKAA
jgi:hypothetical protein